MLFQKPMAVWPDDVKPGSMGGRKPMMIDYPAGQYLLQTVGRRPPVSGAAVGFAAKRMWMIVEMQSILRRAGLSDQPPVMLKDIVISNVSAPRIRIVVDVINAEPVVDPTRPGGIADLRAK